MELREYIRIMKRQRWLFAGVWLAVVAAVAVWQAVKPVMYDVSMSLEVTRNSAETTAEYQYDQYYRLEADDKFSDTLVQWMKDPAVVNDVLSQAGIPADGATLRRLSRTFSAEKLASNYIQVRFQVPETGKGDKIARNVEQVLNGKIADLNQQPQSSNWFSLVYGKPIISQARTSRLLLVVVSVLGGFLAAIMSVLVSHYWKDQAESYNKRSEGNN